MLFEHEGRTSSLPPFVCVCVLLQLLMSLHLIDCHDPLLAYPAVR